jgi:hypothetical protein
MIRGQPQGGIIGNNDFDAQKCGIVFEKGVAKDLFYMIIKIIYEILSDCLHLDFLVHEKYIDPAI